MDKSLRRSCSLTIALLFLAAATASAAEVKPTTIIVKDMHCGGCAKKVAKEVSALAGVAKVETDVEARSVKVTPKVNAVLSPKALWEAIEKADKAPTKLEGPSGTFTAKPKS